MLEIKLYLDVDTTLEEVRAFIKQTESASGDQPICGHNWQGELDGIAVVVDGL